MNGFLVVSHDKVRDVPLRLCASREKALDFIRGLTEGDVCAKEEDVFNMNVTGVASMNIIEFRGGAPMVSAPADDDPPGPPPVKKPGPKGPHKPKGK